MGNSRYTANICAPDNRFCYWPEKQVIFSGVHFSILMVHYSESNSTVFSRGAHTNVPWRNITAANTAGHRSSKQNTSFLSSLMRYWMWTFLFMSTIINYQSLTHLKEESKKPTRYMINEGNLNKKIHSLFHSHNFAHYALQPVDKMLNSTGLVSNVIGFFKNMCI